MPIGLGRGFYSRKEHVVSSERLLGDVSTTSRLARELDSYRENPLAHVRLAHPELQFVTLGELALLPQYARLIDQPLLIESLKLLGAKLSEYGDGVTPLSPHRVWVGVEPAAGQTALSLGGFHYPGLGYHYIQQVSILTLAGPGLNDGLAVDSTLAALELLRGYVHDTMHYRSFRSYRMMPPAPAPGPKPSFYRSQYGINFRRPNGATYSERDRADHASTRNLGIIMEAAVDRFGQELVRALAAGRDYEPPEAPLLQALFHEATGQMGEVDFAWLRAAAEERPRREVLYLEALQSFHRDITQRYERFLDEFDPAGANGLHERILGGIVTGKVRTLVEYFDRQNAGKRQFVQLFKSATY